jgi:hypothetical protein
MDFSVMEESREIEALGWSGQVDDGDKSWFYVTWVCTKILINYVF